MFDDNVMFVYSHPLRLRIIASLNDEGDAAASDLASRLNCSTEDASYHLKILLRYEFVKLVDTTHVRNARKKTYRAIQRLEFPTETWDELPPAVQSQVMFGTFTGSYADAKAALLAGAFAEYPESPVTWTNSKLDLPHWHKLVEIFDRAYLEAKKLAADFKERMEAEGEPMDDLLTISVTLAAFPMPKGSGEDKK